MYVLCLHVGRDAQRMKEDVSFFGAELARLENAAQHPTRYSSPHMKQYARDRAYDALINSVSSIVRCTSGIEALCQAEGVCSPKSSRLKMLINTRWTHLIALDWHPPKLSNFEVLPIYSIDDDRQLETFLVPEAIPLRLRRDTFKVGDRSFRFVAKVERGSGVDPLHELCEEYDGKLRDMVEVFKTEGRTLVGTLHLAFDRFLKTFRSRIYKADICQANFLPSISAQSTLKRNWRFLYVFLSEKNMAATFTPMPACCLSREALEFFRISSHEGIPEHKRLMQVIPETGSLKGRSVFIFCKTEMGKRNLINIRAACMS